MEGVIRQAQIALQVYLKRGHYAIERLEEGNLDDALSLCLWRDAAFHNFRSHDSVLMGAGIDLSTDPNFVALWKDIDQLNLDLAQKLENAMAEVKHEIHQVSHRKAAISRFHSGNISQNYVKRV